MNELLPHEWGDGWMTQNARDLCKLMVAFGGYEREELTLTIFKLHGRKTTMVNSATVERALSIIYNKHNQRRRCEEPRI